ncbi:MAG: hypothetical protein QOF20_2402, partial [Acidimicrobiaceae bacterium]|nr:hypothetical protein [Acidimicrobiaceae bacterium]
ALLTVLTLLTLWTIVSAMSRPVPGGGRGLLFVVLAHCRHSYPGATTSRQLTAPHWQNSEANL